MFKMITRRTSGNDVINVIGTAFNQWNKVVLGQGSTNQSFPAISATPLKAANLLHPLRSGVLSPGAKSGTSAGLCGSSYLWMLALILGCLLTNPFFVLEVMSAPIYYFEPVIAFAVSLIFFVLFWVLFACSLRTFADQFSIIPVPFFDKTINLRTVFVCPFTLISKCLLRVFSSPRPHVLRDFLAVLLSPLTLVLCAWHRAVLYLNCVRFA